MSRCIELHRHDSMIHTHTSVISAFVSCVLYETLTLVVLDSRLVDTTSTGSCSRGVCGGGGDVPLGGAPAQWVSCPRTLQAGNLTFREGPEATCRSRGLKTASVSAADFGVQRGGDNLLDCAGFLTKIHRLLQKKYTSALKSVLLSAP